MSQRLTAQQLIDRIQSGSLNTRSITNHPLYKNALIYFDEDSPEQFIPLDELILYIEKEKIAINEILINKQKFTNMVADLKHRPTRNRDPIMGFVGEEFRKGLRELESSRLIKREGSGKRKSKKKQKKTNKQKFNFKKLRKHITQRLKSIIKTRFKPKKNKIK